MKTFQAIVVLLASIATIGFLLQTRDLLATFSPASNIFVDVVGLSDDDRAATTTAAAAAKYAVVHYLDNQPAYMYGLYSIHQQMLKLGMTPDVVSHVVVVPHNFNSTNLKIVEQWLGPENVRKVDPNDIMRHIPEKQELWKAVFHKLFLFNLTDFDKVITLDLDFLVRANIMHWFGYDTPCGSMEKDTFQWNSGAMVLRPDAALLDEMLRALHDTKRFWGWGLDNKNRVRNKNFTEREDPGNAAYSDQSFLTSFFTDPSRRSRYKRRCFLPREAAPLISTMVQTNHPSTDIEYFKRYRRDALETIHLTTAKPWDKKHDYRNSPFLCDMLREWVATVEGIEEYNVEPFDEYDMFDDCPVEENNNNNNNNSTATTTTTTGATKK
mmetsp:Transcript_44599/g.49996  ORF Transcript_44599/g.49996 Transcript_44599/m.49996 type:complete len:382 (+) Transcript_44599:168-1313(+)